MRFVFYISKKTQKKLLSCLTIAVLLSAGLLVSREVTREPAVARPGLPLARKTVVIDPGHGGYDPGVAKDGVQEKDITLAIALLLRGYLQTGGAWVVMTREYDYDLLYTPSAGPKKRQEMRERKELVEAADPDLVISIHVNSIPSPRWRGAQVFYREECPEGKKLALTIQEELVSILKNTDRGAKPGNYYILNEVSAPAALVETGFLSNPGEARLLTKKSYQSRVAWAIYLGITRYFTDAER